MTSKETPPTAADDFPEFAEPPRHRPHAELAAQRKPPPEPVNEMQEKADALIARLKRERAAKKS